MSGINKAIIVGRLGRDPEIRYTPGGVAVANFSVATSEEWKDRESNEKKERTEWHRIVAFGKLGEICGEYLSKGKLIYVEGRIQTRSWEDKDGNKKYTTEIVASDVQFLDKKDSGSGDYTGKGHDDKTERGTGGPSYHDSRDDDIPF
jgi:single-strand DNA-binding protein